MTTCSSTSTWRRRRVWTPLRLDPSDYARGDSPAIEVFGRLAPGASLADARMQLETIKENVRNAVQTPSGEASRKEQRYG